MVSANTAELVGLEDRGEIAVGKRADLVRVTRCDAEAGDQAGMAPGRADCLKMGNLDGVLKNRKCR
jgi:cytosine/adenosine deaminase-related metal-dependent hydrolase